MQKTPRLRSLALGLTLLLLAAAPVLAAKKPSKKSPHTQIAAVCRVETAPAEKTHRTTGRSSSSTSRSCPSRACRATPPRSRRSPSGTDRRIHVVHDLSCGGAPIALTPGDAAEIRGEYVAVPNGRDLIHFTHPADGSCGAAGGRPDGGIRKIDAAALRKAA